MEILSLNKYSKYNELVKYYDMNRDKPLEEWLSFNTLLDKPGKQGIVGLFDIKSDEKDKDQYIFKMSQYINYLVFQELIVMQGLKEISSYCPHFCKGIGLINCQVDAKYKKEETNPFVIRNKYPIEKEVLLCEFIDKSSKFYNYIRNKNVDEDVLYSIIKQVLLAIAIAQKEKQFSHYDLHSFNVMIKKCDKDLVLLYKLDDENQFCVPTLGYYPVIIDFGFSFISDMNDGPLWPSLAHTNVGFMSDRFDWVADPKLFLVTVSDEIKQKRRTSKSKKLRKIVRHIFSPLNIDWESGWDDVEDNEGATDYILDMLKKHNKISELFKEYDYYCIDLIQSLIIIPLQEQNTDQFDDSYKIFIKEWIKFEREIADPFFNIYILKAVVDLARNVRSRYFRKETRIEAIQIFRRGIYEAIEKVSKFCIPKNVHYEKLLCSLLVFARCMEGYLYKIMNHRMKEKQEEYDQMSVSSVEEIYGIISTNLPDEYVYNENTKVLFIDNVNKECNLVESIQKEEIDNINELTHLARGCYINDLMKK
jgi:hypothetical protein